MKVVFNIIAFFVLIPCFGQNTFEDEITEARRELTKEQDPQEKIAWTLKLISLYKYAHPDVDSLLTDALNLAEAGPYPFYIARTLMKRANYRFFMNEDPELIFKDIVRIDSLSRHINYRALSEWVNKLKFRYYLQIGSIDSAGFHLSNWEKIISLKDSTNQGTFHTYKGLFYRKIKEYKKSIEHFHKALASKGAGKSHILNSLSSLYLEMDNPEKGLEYATEALKRGKYYHNITTVLESLILRGEAYLHMTDTLLAIGSWNEAEQLRKEYYFSKSFTALHRLIDINWRHKNRVDSMLKDIDNYAGLEIFSTLKIKEGMRFSERAQRSKAIQSCNEGLLMAMENQNYDDVIEACDCLIPLYTDLHQFHRVISLLQQKNNYQSKINDRSQIKKLASSLADFEIESEKKLIQAKHDIEEGILNERIKMFKIILFLVLFILALFIFGAYQLRNRNRRIANQNKLISQSLEEKNLLLKEIHHRVKNNLQMVSSLLALQGHSVNGEDAKAALREGNSRIKSMALIHQNLYHQANPYDINAKEYLETLIHEIDTSYNNQNITITYEIDEVLLDIDTVVPLGLITNEIITNSLKHAFPNMDKGLIQIAFQKSKDQCQLRIKDNGIGVKELNQANSFGMTLIRLLTQQLKGELEIHSGGGTLTKVNFTYRSQKVSKKLILSREDKRVV